mmetsp:Transcript_76065/g.178460  ORF Transcript_76065/g.178460 Transcript_76065/m.178460 type:complete len:173 (+) Transcript_76065:278-796(+)
MQSVLFPRDNLRLWVYDDDVGLLTGEEHTFQLFTVDHSVGLSLCLVWSDFPGRPDQTTQLVNDLDLIVVNTADGKRTFPNGLDAPDRVNNVERIRLGPATGRSDVIVKVSGHRVANVGMSRSQSFALVVFGRFAHAAHMDGPVDAAVHVGPTARMLLLAISLLWGVLAFGYC